MYKKVTILICDSNNGNTNSYPDKSNAKISVFDPHAVVATAISPKKITSSTLIHEIGHAKKSTDSEYYLEMRVANVLHEIGIPTHILGYQYLCEAILMVVINKETIHCVSKKLYPSIADKYNSTPGCVEKAIRHAIEMTWARNEIGNKVIYQKKPTNSEFIALIAYKLRLE